ncbi:MAG: class I SAM-dependent methyltransferase [Eubacteriales bacterium]|nr:class I SAM-dependent methyltransferase [Eubacteriales bacterium]
MWTAGNWNEYKVLDASDGEKLESWAGYQLIRPDPQVIWSSPRNLRGWRKPNAHYHRSQKGGGEWEFFDLPETWKLGYTLGQNDAGIPSYNICFHLKPFAFKHTGVFPEQAANWDWSYKLIKERTGNADGRPVKVLNLFAYTGGATLAAAAAGAEVTHVDAAKGMVSWAKENAVSSGLENARIRWLVDDCRKFVEREIRRGNKYDAIIMDPPSYGRGPKGEIWKIEESIYPFVELCSEILSDDPLFFLINSYTTGLQAGVLKYMLDLAITSKFGGSSAADELGLPIADSGFVLPAGASGRWTFDRV